jgi:peptidoglycan/LPS O-acetylase OafA/YrhL
MFMADKHLSGRLAELDALRGIAAVLVVLFHYTWQMRNILPDAVAPAYGLAWGHYGVELFFAISGFVIFMTLERTKTTADFLVSRFARLFPAYWVGVILTTLGVHLLREPSLMQPPSVVLANFTMLQGYLYWPSVDGAYWSLTVELGFYACMLALWRLGVLRNIEWVLVGWFALKLVWFAVPSLPSRVGMLLILAYIPYFAIGVAAYRVRSGARSWMQQLPVLAVGLLSVICVVPAAERWSEGLVFVAVLAIFVGLVRGVLGFLNARLFIWLGGISYPLYLIHQNLGYAIIEHAERVGISVWPAILLALIFSLSAAHLIHVYLEQPALVGVRSWWAARKLSKASARSVPS